MKDDIYYTDLLKRYLENRCTPDEVNELMDLLEKDTSNRLLLTQIKQAFYRQPGQDTPITHEQTDRIRQNLLQKIEGGTVLSPVRGRRWNWLAAAAIILVVTGVYLFRHLLTENREGGYKSKLTTTVKKFDVPPGSDKAILTLADGSMVSLDSTGNGRLIHQGSANVILRNGKLVYGSASAMKNETLYNMVSTPHGGQYHIELPDRSKVWLNAGSSLRFPTQFSGNERRVEMTGEAYFEVAKSQHKPFTVKINNATVEVLGTHFNVMAYTEEPSVNTTLLEGSVKILHPNGDQLLKPGQQSQLTKEGKAKIMNEVDVEEVVAWKNGFFHFETANLETVLRQISRWYDVEVVYENKKADDLFYVDIPRHTNLSEALKVLKLASGAQFTIEGKKIIVKQ